MSCCIALLISASEFILTVLNFMTTKSLSVKSKTVAVVGIRICIFSKLVLSTSYNPVKL